MKKNLLFTTALVAVFGVADAWSVEYLNQSKVGYGAAIDITSENTQITENTSFKNNSVTANGSFGGYGGAVALFDSSLTISDNTEVVFDGNTAVGGGALYLYKNSNATLGKNTTFKNNVAQNGGNYSGGGAIRTDSTSKAPSDIWDGTLILNGTQFENNRADATGGAIVLAGKGTLNVNGATFNNNSSNRYGGAIAGYGNSSNNVSITQGTVFKNNASVLGAGAIDAIGTYNIAEATFDGNTVSNGPAGAVWNEGTMTLADSNFMNNAASATGGAIQNDGTLILTGSNVFSNNTAGDNLNDIHNNKNIEVSGSLELDGGISGNGTTTFTEGSHLIVNTGTTTIANTVKNEGATLNLKLDNGYTGKYTLITDSGSLDNEFTIAQNNLYNIVADKTKKGSYEINKKNSAEIMSSTGANSNQASTIAAVTSGDSNNAIYNNIANNINNLLQSSNSTDVQVALDAATALAPEVNPMVQQVQTSTLSQVFSAISSRMSGGSLASSGNGMASGDNVFEKAAMWVKGLFNKSKLDTTKGFDADSEGLAFGFEKNIRDDVKAGVAYAYTKTDVDGFMRTTDVDTHTLALYGEYKPSNWYVNGIATYGWSDYSEKKNVAGVNVNADYDAETFGLQAMTGYETEYKDYKVTPEAGLRYVHIKQDSYTDTAGQNISSDDLDVVTAVVGAKATRNWELENGTVLKPEVRAALTYDVIDADNSSVVTLANGSAYTVEGEGLDRLGFEFGAGISADVNEKIEITVGYEGKFREDYQDHTGMLNAKYKF